MNEHVLMGVVVAILCAYGLWKARWFLENTRKGQRLVRWFGPDRAPWILRTLLALGIAFGLLLAAGIIRPVQW